LKTDFDKKNLGVECIQAKFRFLWQSGSYYCFDEIVC